MDLTPLLPGTDMLVDYIPLAADVAARLNESEAVAFVRSVLGTPYGNQNFFYSWVDTPDSNYPFPLTAEAVEVRPLLLFG